MSLDQIGFHTLRDERARVCSTTSPMTRACFIITGRCNFMCPYCNGSTCDRDFTVEQVRTLLTDLRTHGLGVTRFTGGEPTLHKGLPEMVGIAQSLRIPSIALSTNGSARPELYRELVAAGVNDFSISADCKDLEMATKLSGRPGTWERVVQNIRMLSGLTYVNIGTTITDENLDRIPETLQFLGDLGVSDVKLATATQFKGEIPPEILDRIPQTLLDRMPVLKYRIEHYRAGRPVRGLREDRDTSLCLWVQDDIILTPDGHYPCIVYPREKGEPIGPLRSVAEMREARRAWAFARSSFEDPICRPFCMDIFADCNRRIVDLQGIIPAERLVRR